MNTKEKIEILDNEIATLKDLQEYCKEKGLGKKHDIKIKIAYASCLREYLLNDGVLKSHLGRLEGDNATYVIGDGLKYYYVIEDSKSKKTIEYVRRLNKLIFDSILEIINFRYSHFRRCV